jgi:hypothetical protein
VGSKALDIPPMPRCAECKEPCSFTPGWHLGQAKNLHCVNPSCPTYMKPKH